MWTGLTFLVLLHGFGVLVGWSTPEGDGVVVAEAVDLVGR